MHLASAEQSVHDNVRPSESIDEPSLPENNKGREAE